MKPFMKYDVLLLVILGLSLVCILLGYFELPELKDKQHYTYLRAGGHILQILFWVLYFYKVHFKKNAAT